MKKITQLKNPDIIEINNEKYQVLVIEDGLYNEKKDDMEWIVKLVKIGEETLTPNYFLTFMGKEPEKVKFFTTIQKTKEEKEQKIINLKF